MSSFHIRLWCVQVRFEPTAGHYLLTASFDRTAKLWDPSRCKLVHKLAGHEGHVASADICPDGTHLVATVSQDRTIKLWAPDETAQEATAMQE